MIYIDICDFALTYIWTSKADYVTGFTGVSVPSYKILLRRKIENWFTDNNVNYEIIFTRVQGNITNKDRIYLGFETESDLLAFTLVWLDNPLEPVILVE